MSTIRRNLIRALTEALRHQRTPPYVAIISAIVAAIRATF